MIGPEDEQTDIISALRHEDDTAVDGFPPVGARHRRRSRTQWGPVAGVAAIVAASAVALYVTYSLGSARMNGPAPVPPAAETVEPTPVEPLVSSPIVRPSRTKPDRVRPRPTSPRAKPTPTDVSTPPPSPARTSPSPTPARVSATPTPSEHPSATPTSGASVSPSTSPEVSLP